MYTYQTRNCFCLLASQQRVNYHFEGVFLHSLSILFFASEKKTQQDNMLLYNQQNWIYTHLFKVHSARA